jgi:hypothetical protein
VSGTGLDAAVKNQKTAIKPLIENHYQSERGRNKRHFEFNRI